MTYSQLVNAPLFLLPNSHSFLPLLPLNSHLLYRTKRLLGPLTCLIPTDVARVDLPPAQCGLTGCLCDRSGQGSARCLVSLLSHSIPSIHVCAKQIADKNYSIQFFDAHGKVMIFNYYLLNSLYLRRRAFVRSAAPA